VFLTGHPAAPPVSECGGEQLREQVVLVDVETRAANHVHTLRQSRIRKSIPVGLATTSTAAGGR
jgi:hypothetical protein